jgi:hypothetical protein
MAPWYGGPRPCNKPPRQDSKNGLPSCHGGYEIDPHSGNEVLLGLTPLDLLIMAEARMALYRLHIPKQIAANEIAAGLLSIRKSVGDPILEMRSDYTIPVYYHSRAFNVIIDLD